MRTLDTYRQRLLERENRRWDEAHAVDTCGWAVPADQRTIAGRASGFLYAGTHVRLARAMLSSVGHTSSHATFVDLGSGKGRVLLLAQERSFIDVVGVEYSGELHATAEANIAAFPMAAGRGRARALLLDAPDFVFPKTPLVVYLNNPFPEETMERVIAHLADSYAQSGRPVTVIYQQLRDEDPEHQTANTRLLANASFLAETSARTGGLVDRALLRPYELRVFQSAECLGS